MGAYTLSPLILSILEKRGIQKEHIGRFLEPQFERDCHSPFLLSDSEKMAERVLRAIDSGERIAVYSDFDCDGIPAAVIMHDLFKLLAYEHVEFYIPDRDTEGFGFHAHAVDKLHERHVSLIITVDVGAAAPETVRHAQSLGIDVIITDHHEYVEPLEAFACVHPQKEPYPFPHLCGAGVAFKCAQAILQYGVANAHPRCTAVRPGMEKWMLDMVALATVADMVPLVDENRCLVHFGIQVLRKSRRPGIRTLCKVARVLQKSLTEDDIGFSLAPRVNAASRMSSPRLAFTLFTTDDEVLAEQLAKELDSLNTKRKSLTASITKQIKKRLEHMTEIPAVIVLGSLEYKPALLGSVATSLAQTYKRPVCLWGREQTGTLKGSARTDGTVSVVALLAGAGDVLIHSGGHEGAGGFAVHHERVHELEQALCASYNSCATVKESTEEVHECIRAQDANQQLMNQLDYMRPFGEGNRKPLWLIHGTAKSVRAFGKEQNHTEILFEEVGGTTMRAYQFFCAPEELAPQPAPGTTVGFLGTLERNAFRSRAIELRIHKMYT